MMEDYRWLRSLSNTRGVKEFLSIALRLEQNGDLHNCATALDRAFAIDPSNQDVTRERRRVLEKLKIEENGVTFRYVPAGEFYMGSEDGEADESPIHLVDIDPFWIMDCCITWSRFCDWVGFSLPPVASTTNEKKLEPLGKHFQWDNDLRRLYCQSAKYSYSDEASLVAMVNKLAEPWTFADGQVFTAPPRNSPASSYHMLHETPTLFDELPMVALDWIQAQHAAESRSRPGVTYRLPTEAEWEKAARGGLVGCHYSWGNDPPTPELCDSDNFDTFKIQTPKSLPPNNYGLYSMCGGVWEHCQDFYDALYYADSPQVNPTGPDSGDERVIRGGSWADCKEVVSVSFRSSAYSGVVDHKKGWRQHTTSSPTVGARFVRIESRLQQALK